MLAARLMVQLLALDGTFANAAYFLGGFFQEPFAGYSAGAIKDRGIFEPETIYAMTVYAVIALIAVLVFAMLRLSLHIALWRAAVAMIRALVRLAAWSAEVGAMGLAAAGRWTVQTGAPMTRRATAAAIARTRFVARTLIDQGAAGLAEAGRWTARTGAPMARRATETAMARTRSATTTLVDLGAAEVQRSGLRLVASVRDPRRPARRIWPPAGSALEADQQPTRLRPRAATNHPEDAA
jgi:hypothetical protein